MLKTVKGKVLGVLGIGSAAVAALPVAASASTPSTAIDFTGTQGLAINPADVISSGFSFMNMFGGWTTLVLALIFAPVAIGFVIWLFKKLPKMAK